MKRVNSCDTKPLKQTKLNFQRYLSKNVENAASNSRTSNAAPHNEPPIKSQIQHFDLDGTEEAVASNNSPTTINVAPQNEPPIDSQIQNVGVDGPEENVGSNNSSIKTNTAEQNELSAQLKEKSNKYIDSFQTFQKGAKQHFVRCTVCLKFPNIVKRFSDNNKIAPITTEAGIRFRSRYVEEHFTSRYHVECEKAEKLTIFQKNIEDRSLIDIHVSKANKKLADHLGKLFFQVFNDAKKLTISGYSWPSRFIATEAGFNFDFEKAGNPSVPNALNVQYVTPSSHLSLLKHIVSSDLEHFKNDLKTAIASSIRIDGSVDRTQLDKIYILLKTMTNDGKMKLNFIAIGKQITSGASGLMDAVRQGICENLGLEMYLLIMKTVSSLVTDGCSLNTGERAGFWVKFEEEMRKLGARQTLLKIWCSAHRLELVWGDLTNSFIQIKKIFDLLSSIASFFHCSSMRKENLKQLANSKSLKLYSLPKIFEVRWTQWTYYTVTNILKSWNTLVLYFKEDDNIKSKGYFIFLTKFKNVETISFLADLLQIYQRYHKSIQSDNLTIMKLIAKVSNLKSALTDLINNSLQGGWEETFRSSIERVGGKIFLKNIELTTENSRSNKSVNLNEFRKQILTSAIEFLNQRFQVESELMNVIDPFINLDKNADIREVHKIFGSDVSLPALTLQYNELAGTGTNVNLSSSVIERLIKYGNYKEYEEVITVFCRIYVCSPQSADVERSIKANNLLKTSFRNNFSLDTENKYLFVNMNLPPLESWNPRPAIVSFINEKERRQHSNLLENETKKNAPYFKGTFEQAVEVDEDENERKEVYYEADKTVTF